MKELKVALVGFGDIGQAFAKILVEKDEEIKKKFDTRISVVSIATKTRGNLVDAWGIDLYKALMSIRNSGKFDKVLGFEAHRTPMELLDSVHYDVMIDLTPLEYKFGKVSAAYIKTAMKRGKHAITANKGTVAWFYKELAELAEKNNCKFMYEATVMDGMPLFNMKRDYLQLCNIVEIKGILNRTTNFILDEMAQQQDKAVEEVMKTIRKEQGATFVEVNPVDDLEGIDAAAKVAVLANVLMDANLSPEDIDREGIMDITPERIAEAEARGNVIKLICRVFRDEDGTIKGQVSPEEISKKDSYAHIEGASSVLTLRTDMVGELTFIEQTRDSQESAAQSAYGILSDLLTLIK